MFTPPIPEPEMTLRAPGDVPPMFAPVAPRSMLTPELTIDASAMLVESRPMWLPMIDAFVAPDPVIRMPSAELRRMASEEMTTFGPVMTNVRNFLASPLTVITGVPANPVPVVPSMVTLRVMVSRLLVRVIVPLNPVKLIVSLVPYAPTATTSPLMLAPR